jgi:hypothetical protein
MDTNTEGVMKRVDRAEPLIPSIPHSLIPLKFVFIRVHSWFPHPTGAFAPAAPLRKTSLRRGLLPD